MGRRLGVLCLVGLKADLQYTIAQCVAVETLYGDNGFLVVGHCHEAEAFALVCLQVANYLNKKCLMKFCYS